MATSFSSYVATWYGGQQLPTPPLPHELTEEKVRGGTKGVINIRFLPYVDDQTGETPAARRAYRKMIADPNVKPALLGKILSVAATDINFEPANEDDALAKQHADFCRWQFTERLQGGIVGLVWSILSGGLIDGFSVNEKVWEVETAGKWAGKHALHKLKAKDTENDLVMLTDEFKNIVGFKGIGYNSGEVFHPSNFVIWRNLSLYDCPTGMSDLRASYGRYWVLDSAVKLRAIGAEKRAFPVLVGHYADSTQKSALEAALANVKSSNWFTAPADAQLEALNIAGSGDTYFRDLIRDLREEVVLGIAGAMLQMLQGGEGVQRGSSGVHKDTADLFKWYLVQAMAQVFNDKHGLIRAVLDPNFANITEYPRAAFGGIDEAELKESLVIDQGLSQIGWHLSRKDLAKRYGRAWAVDDADAVAPPQPPPMGGAPGLPFAETFAGPEVPAQPFRFAESSPDDFQWTEDE